MNEKERTAVWEEYIKTRSPKLREKLIIEYVPLVKVVAGEWECISGIRLNMMI
jgi:RNA polymerase sigma factor for flagellar operon FliA